MNDGSDDEGYEGVRWLQHLGRCDLESLRMIEEGEIAPHKKSQGNWVNGVEAAADEIEERIGTKKYKKRLFLITDGESKTPASQNKIDKLA